MSWSIYSKVRAESVSSHCSAIVRNVVIAGGERLHENRYVRLHIYRCHWCAPIDAHYNTAKQLSQHVRSKHYRLLQGLLATQANLLQHNSQSARGRRARDNEQDESRCFIARRIKPIEIHCRAIDNLTLSHSSALHQDRQRHRTSNVLQSNHNQDASSRLPIPIGLPDSLTGEHSKEETCMHEYGELRS